MRTGLRTLPRPPTSWRV